MELHVRVLCSALARYNLWLPFGCSLGVFPWISVAVTNCICSSKPNQICCKSVIRMTLANVVCQCFSNSTPFYKIMVPTVDTVRYDFLVHSLLQAKRPVLLTGPVGTGKTSLAQKVLQRLDPKVYSLLVINMSAQVCSSVITLIRRILARYPNLNLKS